MIHHLLKDILSSVKEEHKKEMMRGTIKGIEEVSRMLAQSHEGINLENAVYEATLLAEKYINEKMELQDKYTSASAKIFRNAIEQHVTIGAKQ